MKRIHVLIIAAVTVASYVMMNVGVVQAAFLKVDIAAPDNAINSRTFNVEYTALSTDESASIDVDLLQNGSVLRSATTTEPYGDSGSFEVTVPSDGTYTYQFTAVNGGDYAESAVKTVKVDTSSTSAPVYGGVVRDGNKYTVTFTAPDNGDVKQIRIYSSPNPSFTADAATQVAVINVKPGQTVTYTYTAPDDRQRYTAIQAFDGAGNGSGIVSDNNTNVTQGLGRSGQADTGGGLNGSGVAGQGTDQGQGRVDAEGDSRDEGDSSVQGESENSDQKDEDSNNDGSWIAWAIVIALILGTLAYANKDRIQAALKREK